MRLESASCPLAGALSPRAMSGASTVPFCWPGRFSDWVEPGGPSFRRRVLTIGSRLKFFVLDARWPPRGTFARFFAFALAPVSLLEFGQWAHAAIFFIGACPILLMVVLFELD